MHRLAVDLEASAAVGLVAAIRLRASISVILVREAAVSAASSKISSVVVALVVLEALAVSVVLAETLGLISVLVVATADVVVMPVIVLVR